MFTIFERENFEYREHLPGRKLHLAFSEEFPVHFDLINHTKGK